jgi:hypothetical protein
MPVSSPSLSLQLMIYTKTSWYRVIAGALCAKQIAQPERVNEHRLLHFLALAVLAGDVAQAHSADSMRSGAPPPTRDDNNEPNEQQ